MKNYEAFYGYILSYRNLDTLEPDNGNGCKHKNTNFDFWQHINRRLFICQQIVLSRQVMLYIVLLQNEKDTEQMEPWLRREMDSCISSIFLNEDQDSFIQLFNLILSESVNGMNLMGYLKCRC